MEREIYIRRKSAPSVQEGPWSESEFRRRVEERDVQFGDFAWRQGMADWVLAGSLVLFLSQRPRATDCGTVPPLHSADEPTEAAKAAARERDMLLRMDRLPVSAAPPDGSMRVLSPLNLLLSLQPGLPGGRTWRKLAAEFTTLFAARVRHEQAGLLPPHPARMLVGERGWSDAEAGEESMALLAAEELKRRAVRIGAEALASFAVRFEFVSDGQSAKAAGSHPVVVASALAVVSEKTFEGRSALPALSERESELVEGVLMAAQAGELERRSREIEDRARALDERERFLTSAEARVMAMMEVQQVREAEFEQVRENFERRKEQAAREGNAPA